MKKLLALLIFTLLVEHTYAADEIYLDCSHEYDISNGSRSMDFIKINKSSNAVHHYDFLLFYKKNPNYDCSWDDDSCKKKGISRYADGYNDKYGEVKLTIKTLETYTDAYAWKTKFACCGNNWSVYSSTDGVRTSLVKRDTLKYYGSITWPEKSAQSCKILDKGDFNKEIEHYKSRWKTLSEKAAEEQMKKNKI